MLRGWGWGGTFTPPPATRRAAPGGPAGGGLGVAFDFAREAANYFALAKYSEYTLLANR
jgi:hypothetical protein